MNAERSTSLFEQALVRHLAPLQGLRGVQAFVGEGDGWTEAARLGEVPEDVHARFLRDYRPDAGGAVEPLGGAARGWLASYMIGRAGLDLVLVLHLADLEPADLQTRLGEIEAKVGWLVVAALGDRRSARESRAEGGEIGARLLLDAARARSRRALADQWIARLESALAPDLAAVLWMRGEEARLAAISGGGLIERPGEERSLLEALAETAVRARGAMAVGPAAPTEAPPARGLEATPRDASELAAARDREEALARVERIGARRALLLPVFEGERAAAAVVLLYTGETGPDLGGEGGEVLADTLAEALAIQQRAHPGLLRRLGNWAAGLAMAVVGRTAWRLKVVAALLAAGLVVAAIVPSGHRPGFSARVEAAERRVVSAPFDGFIAEAPYQLGDVVASGDLVVAMEDADLRLRLEETRSELAEISAELQAARAERDQAQVRLLEARRAQAEVRRDLIARQLELSRFSARRDAVVVGGDAWRRLGGRVRLGEPLLELAEAGSFRVRAFVDEDWVADVPAEATGEVLLTAYPERPIPVRLAQVGSDPVDRDGVNTFPVRFDFAEPPDMRVLDGMRGIVRVDVGERSVLAAYSRGAVRWIRRTLWRWG